ncbi:hypothetical protein PybrP1_003792 [[Pythium] brassicae (nom. inval.)]|nr:hypothetical protein PybrP1_003792 [[Pythium] brassicae (nom. inval.)]
MASRDKESELQYLKPIQTVARGSSTASSLVQTRRSVNNSLPFVLGGYDNTIFADELFDKEEFHVKVSRNNVTQSIVELFTATKHEVMHTFKRGPVCTMPSMTLVADICTCPTHQTNYLVVRVYVVDHTWKLRSILLGVRFFNFDCVGDAHWARPRMGIVCGAHDKRHYQTRFWAGALKGLTDHRHDRFDRGNSNDGPAGERRQDPGGPL